MKNLYLFLFLSFSFSQSLDSLDIVINNLRTVVENASRTNKKVLVDDFTGLDCPYCGYASLAVSDMLDEFPETLISAQWHLENFTPDYSDFDDCIYNGLAGECFETRASYYGWDTINAVPIEAFNGLEVITGANSQLEAYNGYVPVYQSIVDQATPYNIEINGLKDSLYVDYEVTITMDTDMANDNQYVHIFIAEDNIMSVWWIFGDVDHNARNVVRKWDSVLNLDISQEGDSQTFSGSFTIDDSAWNPDSIKVIALVQNSSTKEVFQVEQMNINNFDSDQDGIIGSEDNCPGLYNPGQEDMDNDQLGDVCDICDNANIWVSGNINGEVDVDQSYTIDIFDLLTLSDLISSDDSESCGYQISDVNNDGATNLLDIFEFVAIIMQG
mgnify:CR=1 FL=1